MKIKALLPVLACAALSFSAQAASVPAYSKTVLPGDVYYFSQSINDPATISAELIGGSSADAYVTLKTTTAAGGTVKYAVYADNDSNVNEIDKGSFIVGATMTDLSNTDDTPFFSFLMQLGNQYVLEITKQDGYAQNTQVNSVPLPGAIWLFGSALLGFFGFSSRRKA
jgi:hypothetical protein